MSYKSLTVLTLRRVTSCSICDMDMRVIRQHDLTWYPSATGMADADTADCDDAVAMTPVATGMACGRAAPLPPPEHTTGCATGSPEPPTGRATGSVCCAP